MLALAACLAAAAAAAAPAPTPETVTFPSGKLTLHGVVYKPTGKGPFPALLWNHGSGKKNDAAWETLGPAFVARGWVLFVPERRGHGLSSDAGPYIMDQVRATMDKSGLDAGVALMIHLHETDHLDDQLAGLAWLRAQPYVDKSRVAVGGNSFGGIQTLLGVEKSGDYCAAVDAAGAAMSWEEAPALQKRLDRAVRAARAPVFFLQAENDFSTAPSKVLSAAMKEAGKPFAIKIYPPFGSTPKEGHSFAYRGVATWAADVFPFLEKSCPARRWF